MPGPEPDLTGNEPPIPRREQRVRPRRADVQQLFETISQTAPEQVKSVTNSLGDRFILVPSGAFRMGSPAEEPGHRLNEAPVHDVVVTQAFYLGIHPVTQAVYQKVVGKNPSRFHVRAGGGPNHPVENVTWDEAVAFCRMLGERPEERAAGRSYRLPTEAEWEYACRSGSATPFGHGASFAAAHGNFASTFPYGDAPPAAPVGKTTPVGSYPPNLFGLHDMHGNVWEWCADWYAGGAYASGPERDPKGPATGAYRVLRGGSWQNQGATCRAAYRNALAPHQRDSATGFRVVLVTGKG